VTAVREIKLLQRIKHDNIVSMIEIVMAQPPDTDVLLAFEYMEHDLSGLLHHPAGKDFFNSGVVALIGCQIARGLRYLHNVAGVVHRDMKCSNILLGRNGLVKLADFGLAKEYFNPFSAELDIDHDDHLVKSANSGNFGFMTNRVITLWYRPLEILLGSDKYGPAVDMWGLGCVLAEMILGQPAFSGSDEISQIESILIGMYSEQSGDDPLATFKGYPWYSFVPEALTKFKPLTGQFSLRERLLSANCNSEMLEMIMRLLCFEPDKRITASAVLEANIFSEFKSASGSLCDLLNSSAFAGLECKSADIRRQTPGQ